MFSKYRWLRQAILDAGIFSEELLLREDQADDQARLVIAGWQGVATASQDGALADEVGVESAALVERQTQRREETLASQEKKTPEGDNPLQVRAASAKVRALVEQGCAQGARTSAAPWLGQAVGMSGKALLGRLCAAEEGKMCGKNISLKTVFYRCLWCRTKASVTARNAFLPDQEGHGSWGPSMAVLVVFMTVEGYRLTDIVRELNVSEPYARLWMSRARFVLAMDAEKRQKDTCFGQLDDGALAFIECDETCVFSWREAGDPAAGVPDVWRWYVYSGILERGTLKFWMKPMKLRQSKGEPRIPQLSKEEFLQALDSQVQPCDARRPLH